MNGRCKLRYLLLFTLAATLLLGGCSSAPASTPEPTLAWTPIPTQARIQPAQPSGSTGANVEAPSQENCTNDAEFVEDLTIPDLTVVEPGSELDKRWLVRNSGSCDWTAGYRLMNVGGEGFEGAGEIALFPARAGASAEVRVVLLAPQDPGEHISRWQARSPDGQPFGDEVYLYIIVPTPTPAPSPTSN